MKRTFDGSNLEPTDVDVDDGPHYEKGMPVHCAKLYPSRRGRSKLPFPKYRQPRHIGCFSLDERRQFQNDDSRKMFLSIPKGPVHFDLNHGYATKAFKEKDGRIEFLDSLLMWILHHRDVFRLSDSASENSTQSDGVRPTFHSSLLTDFICWRGLLTKLLCTPYENQEGWMIAVTKFKDTYYLCEIETYEKIQRREQATEREKLMTYWGHKFETYVSSSKPNENPQPDSILNLTAEYCAITRTRLNSHSLVFGAETDCIDSTSKQSFPMNFVELKTTRRIDHPKQLKSFQKFKLLKWWAQSFLPGIPRVLCGERDDNGVVEDLRWHFVDELPRQAKALGHEAWSPSECMNFCDEFLTLVKNTVARDDHKLVYKMTWYPHQDVECELFDAPCQFSFLPDWYIDTIEGRRAAPDWHGFQPGVR